MSRPRELFTSPIDARHPGCQFWLTASVAARVSVTSRSIASGDHDVSTTEPAPGSRRYSSVFRSPRKSGDSGTGYASQQESDPRCIGS